MIDFEEELRERIQWLHRGEHARKNHSVASLQIAKTKHAIKDLEYQLQVQRERLAQWTQQLNESNEILKTYPPAATMDHIRTLTYKIQPIKASGSTIAMEQLLKELRQPIITPVMGPPPSPLPSPKNHQASNQSPLPFLSCRHTSLDWVDPRTTRMTIPPESFEVSDRLMEVLQLIGRTAALYCPFGKYYVDGHKCYLEQLPNGQSGLEIYQALASAKLDDKKNQTFLFTTPEGGFRGVVRIPKEDTFIDTRDWTCYDHQGHVVKRQRMSS